MTEYQMEPPEFSEMLGVGYKAYDHYEHGRRLPPLKVALKISKALHRYIEDIWPGPYLD